MVKSWCVGSSDLLMRQSAGEAATAEGHRLVDDHLAEVVRLCLATVGKVDDQGAQGGAALQQRHHQTVGEVHVDQLDRPQAGHQPRNKVQRAVGGKGQADQLEVQQIETSGEDGDQAFVAGPVR